MKISKKQLSWTPYTDNLKNDYAIVDNQIMKSIDERGLFSKAGIIYLVKLVDLYLIILKPKRHVRPTKSAGML